MFNNDEQIEATSREERIAARRARIEAKKLSQQQAELEPDAKTKHKKGDSDLGEYYDANEQIESSKQRLQQVKTTGNQVVTQIRVEGDTRENSRRVEAENSKKDRTAELLEEEQRSAKQNAIVQSKWEDLLMHNIPQHLYQEIELQREKCDEIISQKDSIIEEYNKQLEDNRKHYRETLGQQEADIKSLLESMGEQFDLFQSECEKQLREIEDAFVFERSQLIQNNWNELMDLFEKRKNMEEEFMRKRQERIEDHQKQLEELRIKYAEHYNILKMTLTDQIQTLEQQQEEMLATYQLNTQKLDYNFKVLNQRQKENDEITKNQKARLSKLQNTHTKLKAEYEKADKQFRTENQKLTDEYKRITEQYKDLQNKFRHFEISDNKKYRDIWAMNEEIVKEQVQKVLEADRIIHEQQLGLHWLAPAEDLFESGFDTINATSSLALAANSKSQASSSSSASRVPPELIRQMLDLLCNEAGFMAEDKVAEILQEVPQDEQEMMKIDAILKAIGVEKQEDMEKLLTYFMQEPQEVEENEEEEVVPEFIHPNKAIEAIREFVEDHRVDVYERTTSATSSRLNQEAMIRERTRRQEREFWEKMANVIPDSTFRVWGYLEKALQQYNEVLTERSELVQETARLKNQNDELKALLHQYLTAGVNDDLQVPPTRTVATE